MSSIELLQHASYRLSAPIILIFFLLWGVYNSRLTKYYLSKYHPFPMPKTCTYLPSRDVSVIVATIETPDIFVRCLDTWLRNDPLEIIIVTVKPNLSRLRNLISQACLTAGQSAKVSVYSLRAGQVGKRSQVAFGISKARGAIIATPDDGIQWPIRYLEHMLPPFEDETIGAVGSNMTVYIPPSRRDAKVITPWEVAMCRLMFGRRNYEAMWAAARWCWILTGCTGMWRADILNTNEYLDAFLNDKWMGKYRLDVGDDTFTTRWVIAQGYYVAFQAMPETVIERAAKTDSWFLKGQLVRWQRSTVQSFIRTLCYEPRLWNNDQSVYLVRKTIERLLQPFQTAVQIGAWMVSTMNYHMFTFILAAYYIWAQYPSYKAFIDEHPYMRKYWWAAVLADYHYIVVDTWAWCTLNDATWGGRDIAQVLADPEVHQPAAVETATDDTTAMESG